MALNNTNEWIKVSWQWKNLDTRNTNKVDLYDNSNFGVVMTNETSDMTYYIRNIQGELGNKATDWSPCPRDVEDYAASATVNRALLTTSDWVAITNFSNKTNDTRNAFTVLLDRFNVGDTITCSYKYKTEGLTTDSSAGTPKFYLQGSGDVTDWNSGGFQSGPVAPLDANVSETVVSHSFVIIPDHKKNSVWYCNFRTDYLTGGTVYIKEIMISKSDKVEKWSPAPEDTDLNYEKLCGIISSGDANVTRQAEAYTRVELDKIKSYVSETYVTQSALGTAKEELSSSITQTGKDVTASFNKQLSAEMNNFYDFKETVTTSIRFSSDGIEIGKTNSPFKSVFSNTKLSFLQSGKEIAYISNNQMYIENAQILSNLRLGNFTFEPRDNGNLTLKYIG